MEKKKSKQANLERKRGIFFQIGLICSLAITLLAFEWMGEKTTKTSNFEGDPFIPVELPPVRTEVKEKEKKVEKQKEADEIIVKDDNEKLKTEMKVFDNSVKETDSVVIKIENTIEEEDHTDPPFIVQVMPEFKGGFDKWVYKRLRYPKEAMELGLEGQVVVQFIIDEEGNLGNVKVVKSVDPMLDNEVVRVVTNSPKWKPGINNGSYTKVSYYFPIKFRLD